MSHQAQHSSPTAIAYATSLLQLAEERKMLEPIGQDLAAIAKLVGDDQSFAGLLSNPSISETERGAFLGKVFGGRVNPLLSNFLGVMNAKGRMNLLAEIAAAYDAMLDEKLGKVEVDVTVAQKLTAEQLEDVRKRVSASLKKDAVVHQYVEPDIIGGIILRVGDKLIDGSVRHQLQEMKHKILSRKR